MLVAQSLMQITLVRISSAAAIGLSGALNFGLSKFIAINRTAAMPTVIIAKMVHLLITVHGSRRLILLLLSSVECNRFENNSFKISYTMQNG